MKWIQKTAVGAAFLGLVAQPAQLSPQEDEATFRPVERIVHLRVVENNYDPGAPWESPEVRSNQGSGLYLGDGRILTDLELVRYAVAIQARLPGRTQAVAAEVEFEGFDCGLAQLVVEREPFESPATTAIPEYAIDEQLPALASYVRVYGFESERLAVRSAPALAYDRRLMARSDEDRHRLTSLQSVPDGPGPVLAGGPALQSGLIGIFHYEEEDPYVIPTAIIRYFLQDVKDGRYDGFARVGFDFETIANRAHRNYLQLQQLNGGVVIRRVAHGSPAWNVLQRGDTLVEVDSYPVTFDGQLKLSASTVSLEQYLLISRARLKVKVFRAGEFLELELSSANYTGNKLKRASLEDVQPFFMGAGLVFQELNYDLIHGTPAGKNSLLRHRYEQHQSEEVNSEVDRDVVLSARLPDPINQGMEGFRYSVVETVNGRRVRDLKGFAQEWRYTRGRFVVITFLNRADELVLPVEAVQAADRRIDGRYNVQEAGRVR